MVFPAHGPGHCCPIYECHSPLPVETIECPPDSKPLLDLSGCECEMDLCQVPSCPPGETKSILWTENHRINNRINRTVGNFGESFLRL